MQEKNKRVSNVARTQATKAALLKAAKELFVEKGYAETATPEVVKAAGVTRGALYHHFQDKADLFRAVVRGEFEAVTQEIDASAIGAASSATEALLLGSRAYLEAMQDKGRVRILLLDGPAVLGREEMDEIDRQTSEETLRIGLREAINAGEMVNVPVDALTSLLSAMFDRAAQKISGGQDAEDFLQVFETVIMSLSSAKK